MSSRYPWTAATAAACGIDVLVRALAPGCGFGRAARARDRAFAPGDEADARAASARVAAVALAFGGERLARVRAALAAAPDPLAALERARGGETLSDADFFDLARFDDALRELAGLCAGTPVDVPAGDAALATALGPGRRDTAGFYLDDAFDPALAAARGESAARQAEFDALRSRSASRVAAVLGVERIRDGEFVVMRDASPVPLPADVRVVREAPTYLLCELALDEPARAALAERDAAAARVADAEEVVRARLSEAAAGASALLARACAELGELDLLAARGAFAARNAGVVPVLEASGRVALDAARHPPLEAELGAHGRPYVPISLALDGLGVVTGPNMGGKTAALRTLGFAAACAALGVPVPARAARLPLFDEIAWLGIGRDGEGDARDGIDTRLLSAFGAEIVEARALLARPLRRALVLVDEFARTTTPREGGALMVALLETLRERGATGLATTHLAGVATAARVAHYSAGRLRPLPAFSRNAPLDLDAALERIGAAMEYALERTDERGDARSDALTLAAALGLDPALIARADGLLRAEV